MHFGVDIRHLSHPHLTGVGNATLQILRALPRLAPHDRFTLFATGSDTTLARLPEISGPNITVVKKRISNRILFALLTTPGGPTLESFLPEPVNGWWFPDTNIVRTHLPYALTVHDLSTDIFPEFFRIKDRAKQRVAGVQRLTQHAKRLLAVSQSTSTDLSERWSIPAERIIVTHLGVGGQYVPHTAPSDGNYQRGYGLTAPYLLSLATLEPRKNFETVIQAYDQFRTEHPEWTPKLVIAGGKGWKYAPILKEHRRAHHHNDILFLGYVPEKHKPALYRGALAFLFPSFYEGFGLPVLEAMACGTPVITSFTSSLPEVVGDAGIFVDPLNVTDTLQAIEHLVSSPQAADLRAALSAAGTVQAKQFTWEKTTINVLEGLYGLV